MQKLAEKGIRPRTMFAGPIGPGQATSMFRGKVEANVARSREIREIAAAGSNRQGLGGGFKEFNKNVKKIYSKGEFPKRTDMNLNKLKNLIKI